MQILISVSAAAKKKDPSKYEWYRFNGQRIARYYNHHKVYDLDIEPKEVFGVRAARGFVGLVHKDALDIEFRLSFQEFEKLVGRCVGFSGTIEKKKVVAGKLGKDGKAIPKPRGRAASAPATPAGVAGSGIQEDKELTNFLKDLRMLGAKKIFHIHAERAFGKEVYHFYDVSAMLDSYRRKHKLRRPEMGDFEDRLEDLVEKNSGGDIDAEVRRINFKGNYIPVLACLVVED